MARKLTVIAVMAWCSVASAGERFVDLDRPGALETLQKQLPERHAKIVEILRGAEKLPCDLLPQLMRARNARSTGCETLLLMPTNPPKRRITFTLQNTEYAATITTSDTKPELLPKRKKNAD